jgi:putative hydrolase of the HAD superfamily
MALKALMVDVDGVIVAHPDGRRWDHDLEADLGLPSDRLQSEFFKPHFNDIVLGKAALHERLAPVLAQIAPHLTCQQVTDYWFEKDSHLDQDLLAELAGYRALGVELHLATVQEHLRADYLWTGMGLRDRFDAIHYAAALGCKKPEPAFFAAVEARTGFNSDELFFIDDAPRNIAAAQAQGWRAALWTGERRLAELLAEADVTV